jgi:hypothetical protein
MQRLLTELQQHPLAWAFLQPVNKDDVLDYDEVIKKPMGMSVGCRSRMTMLNERPCRFLDNGIQAR